VWLTRLFFLNHLLEQQCGKSRPLAWEMTPIGARLAQVNRVMSTAQLWLNYG